MAGFSLSGFSQGRTTARRFGPLLIAAVLGLFGCNLQQYPQSALDPRSDFAWESQRLLEQQVFWVVVIFLGVLLATIYILIRFRARPGAPEPKHVHGNTLL